MVVPFTACPFRRAAQAHPAQGLTGKKRDYTSLPLSKIQAWSVETAGTFDLDSELDLWFSGLGRVRLEFKGSVDIRHIGQLIGHHVL